MRKTLFLLPLLFSLNSPSFALKGKSVFFPAADDWRVHALYYNPYGDGESGAFFVLIHKQRKNLLEYSGFMRAAESRGYGYLAVDMRGHGKSLSAPDGSTATYKSFSVSGNDNQYNKMTRDIEGAVNFLKDKGIEKKDIILMGAILGANLAIKAAAIDKDIGKVVALTPILNANDVRTVNPLRAYGERPVFMVTSATGKRQYKECQLLFDIAKSIAGKDKAAISVQKRGVGTRLLNHYVTGQIFNWVKNPELPTVYLREKKEPVANAGSPEEDPLIPEEILRDIRENNNGQENEEEE